MNMDFDRKLPIPMKVKEMYPVSSEVAAAIEARRAMIEAVFTGADDRLVLIVGPCSADREDSVLDYVTRLAAVQEKVADKIIIIPRIYTGKPRTTGQGYMGFVHQPDPLEAPDLFNGIISVRELHMRVVDETGFVSAEELLYPQNYKYLDDILGYAAVGARSVENQEHRLVASGIEVPVGMKNPISGDLSVVLNAITAAQDGHDFIYRGWAAHSHGNPMAHCILRGYNDNSGRSFPNYGREWVERIQALYEERPGLVNPTVVIDTNHSNSGKDPFKQPSIIDEVLGYREGDAALKSLVKGFMVESYLVDGCQEPDGGV